MNDGPLRRTTFDWGLGADDRSQFH